MVNEENKQQNFLHLSIKISDRDKIFDKNKIIIEEEFDINEKAFVFLKKNNNQILIDENQNSDQNDEILLFLVEPRKKEYIQLVNNVFKVTFKLTKEIINLIDYSLWYVIKNYPEENMKEEEKAEGTHNDEIKTRLENEKNNIIKGNVNDDYYLSENDIIRLGNFKFILREIHLKNYNKDFFLNNKNKLKYVINKNNNPAFEFTPKLENYKLTEQKDIICSICSKSNCNIDNPIVSLCNCEIYKNQHYECLKKDFQKQIDIYPNKKETSIKSINYILKFIWCCNSQIPLSFEIKEVNKIYKLIDFEKPKEKDYIFFESLEYITKNGGYEKSFHLIELNNDSNNNITTSSIGRDGSKEKNRDNDIKIFEPSVSRDKHAVIEYNKKEGTLLLKNKSKTSDTLIAIKEGLKINKNKIHLQIGRVFIEACLLKENEIKEIRKIKTRKEYDEEIEIEINKKIEEEQMFQNTEQLTNENFFDHSDEEN